MFIIAFGIINKQLLSTIQEGYQVNMGAPSPELTSPNGVSFFCVTLRRKIGPRGALNTTVLQASVEYMVDLSWSQFSEGVSCWK